MSFETTATLGRQSFFPDPQNIDCLASQLNFKGGGKELIESCGGDGNRFFQVLGAKNLTTVDATDYEGADVTLDLNYPLDTGTNQQLASGFSLVFDGGTIEHVFNATQALKNCMEMVALGGHFVAIQMANNYLGHGFYQFSPEFFFAALSKENGFKMCAAILSTTGPINYFSVSSPPTSSHRIALCNDRPTYILIVAQRVEHREIFRNPPQQHFYKEAWESGSTVQTKGPSAFKSKLMRRIPSRIREAGKMLIGYNKFAFSGGGFHRLSQEEVVSGAFIGNSTEVKLSR